MGKLNVIFLILTLLLSFSALGARAKVKKVRRATLPKCPKLSPQGKKFNYMKDKEFHNGKLIKDNCMTEATFTANCDMCPPVYETGHPKCKRGKKMKYRKNQDICK